MLHSAIKDHDRTLKLSATQGGGGGGGLSIEILTYTGTGGALSVEASAPIKAILGISGGDNFIGEFCGIVNTKINDSDSNKLDIYTPTLFLLSTNYGATKEIQVGLSYLSAVDGNKLLPYNISSVFSTSGHKYTAVVVVEK